MQVNEQNDVLGSPVIDVMNGTHLVCSRALTHDHITHLGPELDRITLVEPMPVSGLADILHILTIGNQP